MSSGNNNIQLSMKPFQDFYQAKDWTSATQWLDEHEQVLGTGLAFYNKGVVAIKMNQLPLARYYFEYAKYAGFSEPGIYKNIEYIRNDLGLSSVEDRSFYESTKAKVFSLVSAETITLVFLVIILLTLIYRLKFKIKKSFNFLISILVLSLVIFTFGLVNSTTGKRIVASSEAVVLEEQPVYEGPSAIFEALGKVPAGLKIKLDQKGNGWGKIALPAEFSGWIKLDSGTIKELQ